MILISKEIVDGDEVRYYEGIDFDIVKKHPTDGSEGFIFCFVDSWVGEVKNYNRTNKIDTIVENKELKDNFNIDDINNNYVCIYQTNGNTKETYKTIRENINTRLGKPWLIVPGIR
jgi:hypothetical protein